MSRWVALIILFTACQAPDSEPVQGIYLAAGTQYSKQSIDIDNSVIEWTGTKLMGAGSHSGTLRFKSGYLTFSGERLTGGRVEADMTSLRNTDIPLTDPVPRKKLTAHLYEDFEISQFPQAMFELSHVTRDQNRYRITGKLTIKGITRHLEILAAEHNGAFTCQFSIDRSSWKIGEDNSWLEKKLVDSRISLSVTILTKS